MARLVRRAARATITRTPPALAVSDLWGAVPPPPAGGAAAVPGVRRAAGAGGLADRARHAARRAETHERGATRLTVSSTHTAAGGRRSYLHHTTVAYRDGRRATIYWFARTLRVEETVASLPVGSRITESPVTRRPYLRRA